MGFFFVVFFFFCVKAVLAVMFGFNLGRRSVAPLCYWLTAELYSILMLNTLYIERVAKLFIPAGTRVCNQENRSDLSNEGYTGSYTQIFFFFEN